MVDKQNVVNEVHKNKYKICEINNEYQPDKISQRIFEKYIQPYYANERWKAISKS